MLKIGAAFAYEEAVRRVQELSRAVQADAKLPQKAQVHHMLPQRATMLPQRAICCHKCHYAALRATMPLSEHGCHMALTAA